MDSTVIHCPYHGNGQRVDRWSRWRVNDIASIVIEEEAVAAHVGGRIVAVPAKYYARLKSEGTQLEKNAVFNIGIAIMKQSGPCDIDRTRISVTPCGAGVVVSMVMGSYWHTVTAGALSLAEEKLPFVVDKTSI